MQKEIRRMHIYRPFVRILRLIHVMQLANPVCILYTMYEFAMLIHMALGCIDAAEPALPLCRALLQSGGERHTYIEGTGLQSSFWTSVCPSLFTLSLLPSEVGMALSEVQKPVSSVFNPSASNPSLSISLPTRHLCAPRNTHLIFIILLLTLPTRQHERRRWEF